MSARNENMGGLSGMLRPLMAVLFAALAIWFATEWTAWRLAFQPGLGRPWFQLGAWPIYAPYDLFFWWIAYGAYAPHIFEHAGFFIAAPGGFVGAVAGWSLQAWLTAGPRQSGTYGSARWGKGWDILRAGLLRRQGLVLGKLGFFGLRHDGPGHVLCVAPTRSGKGVGVVIPSLLTWSRSAVVHDIKGENWELTAGWRGSFGRVIRFDPTDDRCDAFNPLMEVRPGPYEVRDAQNIADLLVDPQGSLKDPDHWQRTSHTLLVGVILHVLYAEADKTLAGVARFLSDPSRSIDKALEIMRTAPHRDGAPHPVVAEAAQEMLNKSPNERSGVVSTALSYLSLYRDPIVAAATRRSEWRISDLLSKGAPTTLYLVVPPSDITRTRPLIRLILNQIGRRMTEQKTDPRQSPRLLMLLDEFPMLGRLEFFETSLAYQAGYGIRCLLIAQSLNQLDRAYGQDHSILENCHIRVFFATNDERTALRVSNMLGVATEQRAMTNYSGRRSSAWLGQMSVSQQETARPLMTPDEVMRLPDNRELILVNGRAPILARKVRYFLDERLAARVLAPPEPIDPDRRAEWEAPWRGVIPAPQSEPPKLPEEAGGETTPRPQAKAPTPKDVHDTDFLDDDLPARGDPESLDRFDELRGEGVRRPDTDLDPEIDR